jgi:hypothetical protein
MAVTILVRRYGCALIADHAFDLLIVGVNDCTGFD